MPVTLLAILFILALLALGALISTLSQTQLQANFMAVFVIVPSVLMSGFVFPIEAIPHWLQPVAWSLPMTYFVDAIRGLTLKGASVADLARDFIVLAAFMVGLHAPEPGALPQAARLSDPTERWRRVAGASAVPHPSTSEPTSSVIIARSAVHRRGGEEFFALVPWRAISTMRLRAPGSSTTQHPVVRQGNMRRVFRQAVQHKGETSLRMRECSRLRRVACQNRPPCVHPRRWTRQMAGDWGEPAPPAVDNWRDLRSRRRTTGATRMPTRSGSGGEDSHQRPAAS